MSAVRAIIAAEMRRAVCLLSLLALTACSANESAEDAAPDAAVLSDSEPDAEARDDVASMPDSEPDADAPANDAGIDARADASIDARPDATARDTGVDARADAAVNVPLPRDVTQGASCHALLDRLGIRYTISGPTMGIVDPLRVTTPINGVTFRYASYTAAVTPMLMDCRLAVAFYHLTRELRTRWDVTDVVHLGVYNYRVIAGSTTLSQHSYATALDIANLRTSNGTTHSLVTDFVANGRPTCPPRATNARDRLLKEVACWMHESRVFHIVLTPNYNAAHRDHFHVDLTPGSNFIGFELPPLMDPEPNGWFAPYIDDH